MGNSELKPCPFCEDGGKPERFSMEHFVGNPSNGIVEMEDWVTCIICGASADTHIWNQRAERIVCCKDCKNRLPKGHKFDKYSNEAEQDACGLFSEHDFDWDYTHYWYVKPDTFCAWGELKVVE